MIGKVVSKNTVGTQILVVSMLGVNPHSVAKAEGIITHNQYLQKYTG